MTYLVTGVAGFIGSRIAELLLLDGKEIVGIDSLNDYYDPTLKNWRLGKLREHSKFKFYSGDIQDRSFLNQIFDKATFTAVINMAAMAGVRYSQRFPETYFHTNVLGTLNLLELMRTHGVKKKILASTSSLYAGQKLPFTEELPVNQPLSPYAASKKSAEVLCYTYHHLYGLDISVNRFFTVYGPAGRPDMSVFRFVQAIDQGTPIKLFGDGSQARDFTYIDDIAKGVILSLRPTGYEIVNLGGGKRPVSVNKLIEVIEKKMSKKALIHYEPFSKADMKETWADISKAKEVLNWEPQISLEEGIAETIGWYLREKEWILKLENKNVD